MRPRPGSPLGPRPDPLTIEEEVAERRAFIRGYPHLVKPPPSEGDLLDRWGHADPLVTVVCPTFQQAHLVEDCLHGVLTQETDFPFHVVVVDDASTDGAQDVLRRIGARYPTIVQLELRAVNSRVARANGTERAEDAHRRRLDLIRGEFLALCEGDDFWIDPLKLQRQVDDLRGSGANMSVSGALRFDVLSGASVPLGVVSHSTSYKGRPDAYHHTSTFVMRTSDHRRMVEEFLIGRGMSGDYAYLRFMARHGEIRVLPGAVSVYWSNGRGRYSSLSPYQQVSQDNRNQFRIFWALGPPWSLREGWWILRREAKVHRLARAEGYLRAAVLRTPIAAIVGSTRGIRRLGHLVRGAARRARRAIGSATDRGRTERGPQ